MAVVLAVQAAVVQLVHVILVDDGLVPAAGPVGVGVRLGGGVVGHGHGWGSCSSSPWS